MKVFGNCSFAFFVFWGDLIVDERILLFRFVNVPDVGLVLDEHARGRVLRDTQGVELRRGQLALNLELIHVVLHLINLANQAVEVSGHSAQEIAQGAINLLHLLLNTDNALLELLTQVLGAGLRARVPH